MNYQTRNMTAARPMRYDRVELQPGESFVATPVDARYLIRTGRAKFAATDAASVSAAATEPAIAGNTCRDVEVEVVDQPPADDAPAVGATTMRRTYTRRTPAKVEGA